MYGLSLSPILGREFKSYLHIYEFTYFLDIVIPIKKIR